MRVLRSTYHYIVWGLAVLIVVGIAFLPIISDSNVPTSQVNLSVGTPHVTKTVSASTEPYLPTVAMAFEQQSTPAKVATATAQKTSWASFRNGNLQRGIATSALPQELKLRWSIVDQDGFEASAAIVGDFVYAGALSGYLYCLDRTSGKEIWKYRSIENPDPEKFAAGFKAAPRVTATTIFIGDEEGLFHAVDRKTGKKKWQFATDAEIIGCAAIVGDNVLIGSYDSLLYCLNADTGKKVWQFQTGDRINCSPAVVENFTFVAGCDEHLRVIDIETGKEARDIPLETYLIASPAIYDDLLYVGTHGAEVLAVNWKKGTIAWRYKDDKREFPFHASAAVTKQYVIVGGHDKQLHCIDRQTGKGIWKFATKAQIDSSAVVVGDRVFFGSNDRNIYAVQLQNGKEQWKYNTGKSVVAGIAVGENCMVVGTEGPKGKLLCFGGE